MVKVPVENGNLKKKCPKCQEVIAQEQLKCHVTVSELLPYFLDYRAHLKSFHFYKKRLCLKMCAMCIDSGCAYCPRTDFMWYTAPKTICQMFLWYFDKLRSRIAWWNVGPLGLP